MEWRGHSSILNVMTERLALVFQISAQTQAMLLSV